jgi:glycosyltransferase involved in cell wall biosynthesis
MKKVSMIMPCYNSMPWLDAMLASIIDQTWDNIELIAAYDVSSDDTLESLRVWKPRFARRGYEFKIVENEERLGITGGINKALPYFTGDYITFPDSDDYMFPDFVRTMVSALEEHPQFNWARCDNIMVGDSEPDHVLEYTKAFDKRYERLGSPLCLMLYLIPRSPWRMLAKADFFRGVFPRNVIFQHPSSHEVPLALPLAFAEEPLHIAEPLYKYILHASAYTHSRHRSIHSSIPYLDSMEVVAADCIEQLRADETFKARLHQANRLYYLGAKAYYSTALGQSGLASKYADMLASAMRNFTPESNVPKDFNPMLYWRLFFRYAAHIGVGIYADETDDRACWAQLFGGRFVLYGAGKNCGDAVAMLKDLGVAPSEIWDRNASQIREKEGIAVTAPPAALKSDATVVVTILDHSVSASAEESLRAAGCLDILDASRLAKALRYGMMQKYFPRMIVGEGGE